MSTPNNCKNCARRGDRQYANGTTDCHTPYRTYRVSLGHVCGDYQRQHSDTPLRRSGRRRSFLDWRILADRLRGAA